MGDEQNGALHSASSGGVVGKHPDPDPLEFLVAPSTADEFNTARLRLIPIACFRVDDVRFKFDSSFVLPEVHEEMRAFADLRKDDPRVMDAPISIFGHADPSFQGNFEPSSSTAHSGDEYNKTLSGRRAIAIYALLIRDTSYWNSLYTNHFGGDVWGEDAIRTMLDLTDPPDSDSQQNPSPDSSSGASSQNSSDSARTSRVHDIANDPGKRQQLFLDYMNALCEDLKLDKSKDFLARGAGHDLKGDVQGCSRFNPVLLFSAEDEEYYKELSADKNDVILKAVRDPSNSPNRRVIVLIFRKGSQILPAKWPCPSYKDGPAGCKKRFWSDGDTRRSTHISGSERTFEDSQDTFACRFFHRISSFSPCNRVMRLVTLTIRLVDVYHKPIKPTDYVLEVEKIKFRGQTDKDGMLVQQIPDSATTARLILPMWTVNLIIQPLGPPDSPQGIQYRLDNLGYFAQDLGEADPSFLALMRFQSVVDEQQTDLKDSNGIMQNSTKNKLIQVYGN
jgi:hypothetical protein